MYITDVSSGTHTRLEGVGSASQVTWSPDGTQVAYISDPAQGTGLGFDRVFVRTLATGDTSQVFPRDGVEYPTGTRMEQLRWSPDGSRLAFVSSSWRLVDGDTNRSDDVFVLSLGDGQLQRVSTSADGKQAAGDSSDPVWSPDGTRIAFVSYARNLVPIKDACKTCQPGVYVKTLGTGAIQQIAAGEELDSAADTAWSPDGSKMAFSAGLTFSTSKKLKSAGEVFVQALDTGVLRVVSTGSTPKPANFNEVSFSPRWSPDGTRIAFVNSQGELIKGIDPGTDQVYVRKLSR